MKRALAIGIISCALSGPAAFAADPVISTYDWSGFYAGVNGGWAWANADATETLVPGSTAYNGIGNSWSADIDGFTGGVQAGYNWQPNQSPLVLGVEGDVGYLGLKGDATSPLAITQSSGTKIETDGGLFGTLRARAGFAADNLLFYATGGLIVADINAQITDPVFVFPIAPSEKTSLQTGWTVGGGVEWAHEQWSLKAEYLYYDLGKDNVYASHVGADGGHGWDIDTTGNIVRVGINYHFAP